MTDDFGRTGSAAAQGPTAWSNRCAAFHFAWRVLIFLAPLLAVGLATHWLLFRVGESWSMVRVLDFEAERRARGQETLFAREIVSEEMRRYKAANLRRRAPQVVALGSSTVMQLRAFHFGPYADVFYNAGGLVQHPGDFVAVAQRFDAVGWPRFVALGLDMWWFNSRWSPSRKIIPLERIAKNSELDADWDARLQAYPEVLSLLMSSRGRSQLARLFEADPHLASRAEIGGPERIGLLALNGAGFRGSDGSWRNMEFIGRRSQQLPYADGEDTILRIESGKKRFERGRLAVYRVDELRDFLSAAASAGAIVAGFTIPFDSQVRQALFASPEHRELLQAYRTQMHDLFSDRAFPFADTTDHFGLGDQWMINGFHGSERSMAHVVRAWLAHPASHAALPELDRSAVDCVIEAAEREGLFDGPGHCVASGAGGRALN